VTGSNITRGACFDRCISEYHRKAGEDWLEAQAELLTMIAVCVLRRAGVLKDEQSC